MFSSCSKQIVRWAAISISFEEQSYSSAYRQHKKRKVIRKCVHKIDNFDAKQIRFLKKRANLLGYMPNKCKRHIEIWVNIG